MDYRDFAVFNALFINRAIQCSCGGYSEITCTPGGREVSAFFVPENKNVFNLNTA